MNYAFFIHLRATPAWLRLTRAERKSAGDKHLQPLLERFAGKLRMRYFDAEAFSAVCSDVMMIETDDPQHYYFFFEALRDTPLIAHAYFEVVQIIASVEDGYRTYEASLADGARFCSNCAAPVARG